MSDVAEQVAAEGLDREAYFARIGDTGDRAPTAATLARIHRAHARSIPFENLDIHLGRPIRIDLPSVVAKLVDGGRGGYCFEQSSLFAAVLEALGFPVTRLAARVVIPGPGGATMARPRTHMLLAVEAGGGRWLCDVGFGGATPMEPIPLVANVEAPVDEWTYRLRHAAGHGGGTWTLQLRQAVGWLDLYEFTEEPQCAADYEMANYFTSTHPSSGFVKAITAQRPGPDVQLVLRDRELSEYRPDGVTSRTLASPEEVLEVLADHFGLRFPPGTRFRSPSGTATATGGQSDAPG